uniref:Uncharacterized protein n=1 Tax=Arundo donax TaxID=35708 RepID=A0A0A9HL20_ARUDO
MIFDFQSIFSCLGLDACSFVPHTLPFSFYRSISLVICSLYRSIFTCHMYIEYSCLRAPTFAKTLLVPSNSTKTAITLCLPTCWQLKKQCFIYSWGRVRTRVYLKSYCI